MAGYTVIRSLSQTIKQILNHAEYPISVNGAQQIRRLQEKADQFLEYLIEFGVEGSRLERRIRDAANEAEDVIEHWMHEHIRSTAAGLAPDVEYDFGELNMAMEEIYSLDQEVDEHIQQEMAKLYARPRPRPRRVVMLQPSPTPTPAVDSFTAVGLEEQVDKLRDELCGISIGMTTLAITGMGGIGKTTLARAVFEDERVVKDFPVRAWIDVSQNYRLENIFEKLLFSLERQVQRGLVKDGATTREKIFQICRLNKCLIVVDDLWSSGTWFHIRKAFGKDIDCRRNRFMITTRSGEVALDATESSRFHHKMGLMDEAQSWCMLKQKVFQSKECPSELEKIGKVIAKTCKGLPLAIVVAARILSQTNQTQSSWDEVAPNIRSLIVEDEQFIKIMSLSYTELPHYLRPLFLYMCGFHDDYEIRVSMLIKLWKAEGFFTYPGSPEESVKHFVSTNLAFATAIKSNGKVKSCSIHDLLRDLFKRKALYENYERRISNSHLDLREVARGYASTMRTIISFQRNESSLRGLRKFKLLRVLDLVDTDAYSLPASVFDLFHLRYLAFGCPMEVPSSISRLQNLRSLIIRPSKRSRKYRYNSRDEVYLPLEIWMMPLLTHLVSFFDLLPNPERAASALKELHTLSVVTKLICTEEMMELICNVEKLSITYFGDRYQQDYQLHNLALLSQLEKLTLVVKEGSHLLQTKAKPVFPERLKKLTLSGWRFPWEDMKAIADLPYLEVLKLRDHAFQGHTWETDSEEDEERLFDSLKYLLIEESDIEKWEAEKRHFRGLERLVFKGCANLSQIPKYMRYIHGLQLIEVDRANLTLLECFRQMQVTRNDMWVKVLIIREL
ncbi:putative late blight resistance protein R1B-14 [Salvia divinorum]|uniref:Late blight resistance protein R1B-14 n=1 Tax=Salvia divinorum TaxID=28513 RepID=A0ABD1H6N2_SALDI